MPLAGEGSPQLAHRLARPFEQALGISLGFQQLFQIGSQRRVLGGVLFPATALLAYPLPWLIASARLQFSDACADRFSRDSGLAGYQADPSPPNPLGLCRHIQSPLSLVQPALHQLVLGFS